MTPYHAKYYAHELSRTGGDDEDRITRGSSGAANFKILNPN